MAKREYMIVKSTLDFLVHSAVEEVIAELGEQVVVSEVEDVTQLDTVLKERDAAALYQLIKFEEAPRAPRFQLSFNVGAKTTDDGANMLLARILDLLGETFKSTETFDLRDYSTAADGPVMGRMMLTAVGANPQQFDKQSGIRMISCAASVMCVGR